MRKFILIVFLLFFFNEGKTQTDTTLNLLPVSVTSSQIQHFEKGRSINEFDSLKLNQYSGQSLGDILSQETGVFIKERSPGNLSTPSIRGTGFGHVAILWNGFPVQSPMNGGIDFSIFSVDAFNHISLIKGGNSAIYGSGAIGGTISLENNLKLSETYQLNGDFSSNVNSNKDFGIHLNMRSSTDFVAANLSIGYQNNQNHFRFGKDKIQKNSHHILENNAVSILVKIKKNQWIKFWANNSQANREIASSRTAAYNSEKMFTISTRVGTEWSILKEKSKQTVRLGIFRDSLNFSSLSIDSRSRTMLFIGQFLSKHYLKKHINFEWGFNYDYALAKGNSIIHKERNQWAAFANLSYVRKKWSTSFSMREALIDQNIIPFTFTWGHQYLLSNTFSLLGNISRNFRTPTFNDLYWPGLGNPNLKSEKGWSGEIGLKYHHKQLTLSSTYFRIYGVDWIIWSPNTEGFWMPNNNLKVISQGLEMGMKYTKKYDEWSYGIYTNGTYVKSILKENYRNHSDKDIGKQLIYVPEWRGNISLRIAYKRIHVNYSQIFTSSVRTIQKQLDGYAIGNLGLQYHLILLKRKLSINIDVKNIWNKNYEVVSYYPMPLRYFTFRVKYFL